MGSINVVAAVVDTTQLTLYKSDGSTISIPQGDPRIRGILDEITPTISKGGTAIINIDNENIYKDFEEKSEGKVKFWRVLKSKVKHLFGMAPETPQVIGQVPVPTPEGDPVLPEYEQRDGLSHAIDDIMAHAESVSAPDYVPSETTEDHTIIAVHEDKHIVPHMEKLKDQIAHATKVGNTKGVEALVKRLGSVIHNRGHETKDLLHFLERGDLPVADDGSIIAYKVLASHNDGDFVDCHTHRVHQKVGDYVFMKETLVDKSRRHECSTGLHVARRGYLGGFNGDIITLIKINPEDVIAVPEGEPNKMRVCGYHILGTIPKSEHKTLRQNKPMGAETETGKLLATAIHGGHVHRLRTVEIGAAHGGDILITPLVHHQTAKANVRKATATQEAIAPEEVMKEQEKKVAPAVDPKKVSEEAVQAKTADIPTHRQLFIDRKFDELTALKKKKKISWEKLGFNEKEIKIILGNPNTMSKDEVTKQEKVVSKMAPIVEAVSEVNEPTIVSPQVKARKLFDLAVAGNKSEWGSLWTMKKKSKKSWAFYGFSAKEIERLNTNKPDWV